MTFETLALTGPRLLKPRRFNDDRGFFTERFRQDLWQKEFPHHPGFVQDNYSWSKFAVLRGMHFQTGQGKLVTCVQGSIIDVIVDIRLDSPTLGKHLAVELNAAEPTWLWVPAGFAHGFYVTDLQGAGVIYKVDRSWEPAAEGSIRWNDPDLKIPWPANAAPVLSGKDADAGSYRDFLSARKASTKASDQGRI